MADILDTPQAGAAAVRGGIVRTVSAATGLVLTAASAVVLLRYLSVTDYGRYATVVALVTIVAGVTEAGMTNIAVREFSVRSGEDRARLMRNLLGLRLVLTTVGVLLAVAFAVAAHYASVMVAGAALAGTGLWLLVAQVHAQTPLHAGLRLGWVSAFELLRPALTFLLLLALALIGAPLIALFAVPVPVLAVVLAVTVPLVRGRVPLVPAFQRSEWRRLMRLTAPYAAVTAVSAVYVYVSVVLLSLVASEHETGLFGAAFRIFNTVYQFPFVVVTSAFPILARAAQTDLARLRYAVQRLLEASLLMGVVLALAIGFGAPAILDVLAGPAYRDAVPALRVQGAAVVLTFVATAAGYTLLSLHRHSALVAANAVALGTSSILTLTLGTSLGAIGAACAVLTGEAVLLAGYAVTLSVGGDGFRPLTVPVRRIAAAAVIATGAGLPLISLPIAAAVTSCAVFCGATVALRLVPPELAALVSASPFRTRSR